MGDQMDLSNIDANSLTPAVDDDFNWHSGPFVGGRGNFGGTRDVRKSAIG